VTKDNIQFSRKIKKQLQKRGWTEEMVKSVRQNPSRTVQTRDTRYNPDGTQNDEPATIYFQNDRQYIICNDLTGDIVQISNRYDDDWISPL
jgi:hypothetical protein